MDLERSWDESKTVPHCKQRQIDPKKVVAGPQREPVNGKRPNVLLLPNGSLGLRA